MKAFTQTEDIDLDASEKALLETFRRNEGSSLKTLIGIYKGHYLKLFFSILFLPSSTPRYGYCLSLLPILLMLPRKDPIMQAQLF